MSRQLVHSIHLVVGFSGRKYNSPSFAGYNQIIYSRYVWLGLDSRRRSTSHLVGNSSHIGSPGYLLLGVAGTIHEFFT